MARYKFDGYEAQVRRRGPYVYVSIRRTVSRSEGLEFPWLEVAKLDREPNMGEIQNALRNFEYPEDYGPLPS